MLPQNFYDVKVQTVWHINNKQLTPTNNTQYRIISDPWSFSNVIFVYQLWKYREGIPTHVGLGHAGVVTSVRFSPDLRIIVSASSDGAIFIWKCPVSAELPETPKSKESIKSRSTCSLREMQMKPPSREENIADISQEQNIRAESKKGESVPHTPYAKG